MNEALNVDNYLISLDEKVDFSKSLLMSDKWKIIDRTQIKSDIYGSEIFNENGNAEFESMITDISSLYKGMSLEYQLSIKIFLMMKFKHKNEIILSKKSTFNSVKGLLSYITRALKTLGLLRLSDLNDKNIKVFCINLVKTKKINGQRSRYNGLIPHEIYIKCLKILGDMNIDSEILGLIDAPKVSISLDICEGFIKNDVDKLISWKDWIRGDSLGKVPLEISIFMLSEALDYFKKDDIKRLVLLSQSISECSIHNKIEDFRIIRKATERFISGDYSFDKKGVFYLVSRCRNDKNHVYKKYLNNPSGYKSNTLEIAERYFSKCKDLGIGHKMDCELNTLDQLTTAIRLTVYRISATLAILTGVRLSELASITVDSFDFKNDGGTFISKIKKTNHNIETIRPITAHAEPLSWIAIGLSNHGYHHGVKNPTPQLLKITQAYASCNVLINALNWGKSASRNSDRIGNIKSLYSNLLSNSIVDFDPDKTPFSSHRFRFTWAELAIRRFDGNVPEAIRNYFRHWYGSVMTMKYIRDRVKADLPEISREYMRELIHRTCYEDEEFYGPAGRYLLSRIRNLEAITPNEIDDLMSEFDVLEVHEYSYCMIPKIYKSQAKCYEKTTQTPQYENARFEHCGGCIGRFALGNGSHRDEIMRIGMTTQEIINSNTLKGIPSLNITFWNKILKQAEIALADFDNRITITDITDKEI